VGVLHWQEVGADLADRCGESPGEGRGSGLTYWAVPTLLWPVTKVWALDRQETCTDARRTCRE